MSMKKAINQAIKKVANKQRISQAELNGMRNRVGLIDQKKAEIAIIENEYSYYIQGVLRAHKCDLGKHYSINIANGDIVVAEEKPAGGIVTGKGAPPPKVDGQGTDLNLTKPTSKFINEQNKPHYEKLLKRPLAIGEVIDMESTPVK